jgi:hypothetical protein
MRGWAGLRPVPRKEFSSFFIPFPKHFFKKGLNSIKTKTTHSTKMKIKYDPV